MEPYTIRLFKPTEGHWAADVYNSENKRIHCGQGHTALFQAMKEASYFIVELESKK